MLALALTILSVVSTTPSIGVDHVAADYLRPMLQSIGGAARINYSGTCNGPQTVLFPKINAQAPSQATTGMAAVQQIFQNDPRVTVTQDPSGIPTITIGTVSTALLQAKFGMLALSPAAQYNAQSAVETIAFAMNTYAVKHGLHFDLDLVVNHQVSGLSGGTTYLPPTMNNVTADDALDSVLRTFNGIILFGTCSQPDGTVSFAVDYIDGT